MNNLCDTLNPQKEIKIKIIKKRTGAIVAPPEWRTTRTDRRRKQTARKKQKTKNMLVDALQTKPQKEVEIIEMRAKWLVVI